LDDTDSSAPKEAEQEQRRAEERFHGLLEAAPDAIVVCDASGRIQLVNSQVEVLFGYPRAELIGQPVEMLLSPALHARHVRHRAGYVADPHTRPIGSGLELYARTRDGREVPVEISLSPLIRTLRSDDSPGHSLASEDELLVTAVIRDISARRAAEAALRESELRLRTVMASAPVILFSLDMDGIVTLCEGQGLVSLGWIGKSSVAMRQQGLAPSAVVGQPVTVLFRGDKSILDHVRRTLAGADSAFVSQAGGVALDTSLVPLRDERGDVRGVIGVATDITERVRAEAAERAVRARDEFLSVAAHELKTPLTSLRGFAQILLTYLKGGTLVSPERIQRALGQIEGQTEKVNRLVDQLLDVTRLEAGRLSLDQKATDLSQLVHEVVTAAQGQTSTHTLTVNTPHTAWAWVDALRLEQVLANLISNAVKYSPAGGSIEVSVEIDTAQETVQLAVRDHGLGISEEHRAHIFDRFYQAHASSFPSGLGLGLYISREIVALHGGQLTAEFPSDGGSLFVVRLPIGGTGIDRSTRDEEQAGPKRVLVVDDDASIRDLVDLVLSDQGYEVIAASDGQAALALVERTTPDVILLDMHMPVLDGWTFADTYRAQPGPHAPIIVCTAAREAATSAAEIQATAYLAKPFAVKDLCGLVNRLFAMSESG
jgi:protein-histidine pros-kinase